MKLIGKIYVYKLKGGIRDNVHWYKDIYPALTGSNLTFELII